MTKAWADSGYRLTAIEHGARLGIDVHGDPAGKGFKVIPHWVGERTFGLAMIDLMSRRLTR